MKIKEPYQPIDSDLWYFETELGLSGPYMCESIAWVKFYKIMILNALTNL